jgi:ergothioneine biosynthesis protein EgtB
MNVTTLHNPMGNQPTEAPPYHAVTAARYAAIRQRTMDLVAPLSEGDCQVQSMPDASPVKWHLAHVSWFFETFVLALHEPGHREFHPAYRVLFNSYYHGVGAQHPRAQRGLVTRPNLVEVIAYRRAIDARMLDVLSQSRLAPELLARIELGLQHEQQHQELILTDVKHLYACNPLAPPYRSPSPDSMPPAMALTWSWQEGGPCLVGHDGTGFAFDNEQPRHRQWLEPFGLANRLITQGEWLAFIEDGGYADPRWWLSAGWDWVRSQGIEAPMYWRRTGDDGRSWRVFTLQGERPIETQTPVVHVSLFEADAYAHWRSAQEHMQLHLPTEAQWEHVSQGLVDDTARANLSERNTFHPQPAPASASSKSLQLFGDAWEWTSSAYQAYPGFRPWAGAIGEYNGKFMINQSVLRGGSCVTPQDHIRASYRNFFPTDTRWQFSGVRLAACAP